MLDSIITSKTRIQLLLRFFLNPERSAYLRELAAEIGESSNAVRLELNHLAKSRLIVSRPQGRIKSYQANRSHPLFPDIQSIVKKSLGIDKVIDDVVSKIGDLKLALVTGDYALGIDGGIIDLVLVGDINRDYLNELIRITEPRIGNRKIRCLCLSEDEYAALESKLKQKGVFEIFHG